MVNIDTALLRNRVLSLLRYFCGEWISTETISLALQLPVESIVHTLLDLYSDKKVEQRHDKDQGNLWTLKVGGPQHRYGSTESA